jgi:hypothetical protein
LIRLPTGEICRRPHAKRLLFSGAYSTSVMPKVRRTVRLVGGKPVEMPVEQVRHLGLLNRQQLGDLALLELPPDQQLVDMGAELRTCEPLVGIV